MPFYFAYGSNMNQNDLNQWCKKKNFRQIDLRSKSPRRAKLPDFTLAFDHYSTSRQGGSADIVCSPGEHVWGVVFKMNDDDLKMIKEKERAPRVYVRRSVSLLLEDGTTEDATTYEIKKELKGQQVVPPTKEYLKVIIDGATDFGLPEEWIRKLREVITAPSPL